MKNFVQQRPKSVSRIDRDRSRLQLGPARRSRAALDTRSYRPQTRARAAPGRRAAAARALLLH